MIRSQQEKHIERAINVCFIFFKVHAYHKLSRTTLNKVHVYHKLSTLF